MRLRNWVRTPLLSGPLSTFSCSNVSRFLLVQTQRIPPILQAINNEITGLIRTPKVDVQLPTILIDNTTRNVLFLAPQIVVTRLIMSSCFPTS